MYPNPYRLPGVIVSHRSKICAAVTRVTFTKAHTLPLGGASMPAWADPPDSTLEGLLSERPASTFALLEVSI